MTSKSLLCITEKVRVMLDLNDSVIVVVPFALSLRERRCSDVQSGGFLVLEMAPRGRIKRVCDGCEVGGARREYSLEIRNRAPSISCSHTVE